MYDDFGHPNWVVIRRLVEHSHSGAAPSGQEWFQLLRETMTKQFGHETRTQCGTRRVWMNKNTYTRWRKGKAPSLATVIEICRAYGWQQEVVLQQMSFEGRQPEQPLLPFGAEPIIIK